MNGQQTGDDLSPTLLARRELAGALEQSFRAAATRRAELELTCRNVAEHRLLALCVPSSRVAEAVTWLEDSDVKVCCTVAFPHGDQDADVKRFETEVAIDGGAQLIEVVANVGRLKDGDERYVLRELLDVVEAAEERPVSVSLDLSVVTGHELERAVRLIRDAGAGGITITGMSTGQEMAPAVQLVRAMAGPETRIKAEPLGLDLDAVRALLQAGAVRFGTADGAALLRGLP